MPNDRIAYLAGLFDGEGSFSMSIQGTNSSICVHFLVSMTLKYKSDILEVYKSTFGGNIYLDRRDNVRRWVVGKRQDCKEAATVLLPYLYIKKEIAEQFLQGIELMDFSKQGKKVDWTPELLDNIGKIAFTLNPSTARTSTRGQQYLNDLKQKYLIYR